MIEEKIDNCVENTTKKCAQWYLARIQRKMEMDAGLGESGTLGFRSCYGCEGYNKYCKGYSVLPQEEYSFLISRLEEVMK